MAKTILKIKGMSCEHCVKTVTDCLSEQDGVEKVKVHLKKGEAKVIFDHLLQTSEKLSDIVTLAGYESSVLK
ncbi:copper chaperone [Carnobacterium divergens]|uniref:HMA domain-containing protein n=2 Tax=Carnobacterium divergens TaxID=2748 RepID=A0A0R2HUE9_CARDV|nr:cation transporter [Carnobacterium divergens]ANZ99745.1 copper-binding protein [Carnobacterium divergens]KRN56248.1 hypothetical protein IV74_GL001360 [Carnobacterium divergens DSM 20623]MDO0875161.1 cation transporter [Carnobacterium divergens]MDT1958851.1 cation transporter [Carnobacterium divergens]MDT1974819.1 cation transporter [Carnobacterium divergens]